MSELTKLETMYYHMRDRKHVQFLETHELYAWFRNINTFKGSKKIIDACMPEQKDRGMTQTPKQEV